MTELYKIVNGIAPPIINYLFQFCCNTHNIRNFLEIFTENRKTVKYGTGTVTDRALFLWANLHTKYKSVKSLDVSVLNVISHNVCYAKSTCES